MNDDTPPRSGLDLDPGRSALILIEFHREWLEEDSLLRRRLVRDESHFVSPVETAASVLNAARKYDWRIVHAGLDSRSDPTYQIFAGGRGVSGLREAIPCAGTWRDSGPEYPEPFSPRAGEFLVAGRSGASVLKNSTLDPYLRNNDIRTLLLMGFATHVCVESTLREAHDLGYNAILVHDACAAFEEAQQQHVRSHVVPHFGQEISALRLISHMRAVERVLS